MAANDNTMNAVRIHAFGDADRLVYESAPRPVPQAGEVLIRVRAAGVNPVDWKTREGKGVAGYMKDLPAILGWDVAGTVDALGPGVDAFRIGESVYGMIRFPNPGNAYAEYVTAPVSDIARMPVSLDYAQAAALPLAALTAWQAFTAGGLQAGQRVLVHAAAGGVGHLAVQLAKWKGASVVGTASARNADFVRSLGAEFYDYAAAPFEKQLSGFDLVLDAVGGDIAQRSYSVLKPGGIVVSILGGAKEEEARKHGMRATSILVKTSGSELAEIASLVSRGALRPEVQAILDLPEASKAHDLVKAGHVRGKVVLRVQPE
jgi:NADPH:quinone reductase-like Zn-dependent oxidoreductase